MTDKATPFMIVVKDHGEYIQQQERTLLQSLEDNQLDVHYHCREGFCGACRTRILKGSVHYVTEPLAYIDDDEILPCSCIATSDIEIELS